MHLCNELSLHILMAIIACKLAFVRTRKQMDVVRKKNPGKYTHWKIKKIKMQSHCVCSCVCAVKWFFLASASEYSQWKHYYKRQQVVSAELIKDRDCRSRHGPTMWLTILSKGIIISQKLTLEWKSHLGRDGNAWNPGKQWEGYEESTDSMEASSHLPFISPLSCATDAAARCAKHGTPPRLLQTGIPDFL